MAGGAALTRSAPGCYVSRFQGEDRHPLRTNCWRGIIKNEKLLIITCACLFIAAGAAAASGGVTDELHIGVGLTAGEHSRDSSSKTTTITVDGDVIAWVKTFGGRRRRTPPLRKQFALSPADKEALLRLIRSNHLLVTGSIELPQDGSSFSYFRISVDLSLGKAKGAINISGLSTAVRVKEKKLYQNTLTLVKELYRIISSQDNSIRFEELIRDPIEE